MSKVCQNSDFSALHAQYGRWKSYSGSTTVGENLVADLEYDVGKDTFYAKVKDGEADTEKDIKRQLYEGWNAGYSTKSTRDRKQEYVDKFKAFNCRVEAKRTNIWCFNVQLTGYFIEAVQLVRFALGRLRREARRTSRMRPPRPREWRAQAAAPCWMK